MPRFALIALCCFLPAGARAEEPAAPAAGWEHVTVPPMKTSIYVGSVTLTTSAFQRTGTTLTATYSARVFPWIFWSESGEITIGLTDAAFASLAKGENVEFAGDAANLKKKPRKVTGRIQPADADSGRIKVKILADGLELIFNGSYRFSGP